ncbi:MAG: UDP-2,3-diacylglucosamine pyrophosphatase [Rickettsiales bacterium]|nr:UDP-2,3-diacylglucosamine pyrophosphatase [Rickettsiales bacterium]|tara:strand:- start:46160 stop:46987 length:828 start_codon:yes stop_codon:yes gene_type:complete
MHAGGKVGILCGGGLLPKLVAEALQANQQPFFLVVLEGQNQRDWYQNYPHVVVAMGSVGLILKMLRENDVKVLTLAGSVKRPSLDKLKLDWQGVKWLARMKLFRSGDDQTLSWVIDALAKEGFEVQAPHDFIPQALTPKGVLTTVQPDADAFRDMDRGFDVAKTLGALDVGQAVIVEHGLVLSVEGIEGTAEMIKRTKALKREDKKTGALIKAAKPQQTKLADLPAIGPDTIDQLADCGLAGVALEAGSSLILDLDQTLAKANKKGIFVYGYVKE